MGSHHAWQVLHPAIACLAQSMARSGHLDLAQNQLEKFYSGFLWVHLTLLCLHVAERGAWGL